MYITSLDLLVLVFAAFAAATVAVICLMFLLKNQRAKKVMFYASVVLGALISAAGLYIAFSGMFAFDIMIAIVSAAAVIASAILAHRSKFSGKLFVVAQILSAAVLVIGIYNIFLW